LSTEKFGSTCIKNIYKVCGIDNSRKIKDKERYLNNTIIKKLKATRKSNEVKEILVNKYITYMYLRKLTKEHSIKYII